jgi:putative transposase
MQQNGIRSRQKSRYRATIISQHGLLAALNLLDQYVMPSAINQVWTSDITYLWIHEGWLSRAIVLGLFNLIVRSIEPHMNAALVTDAPRRG